MVGRLAQRHGIRVELLEGVPAGVTARMKLPDTAIFGRDDQAQPAPVEAPCNRESWLWALWRRFYSVSWRGG